MEVITLLEKLEDVQNRLTKHRISRKPLSCCIVSQPTVSAHIKQLEEELSTQLFIRNGRMNISATPSSPALSRGLNLLDDWQHLYQEIQQVRNSWFHAGSVFPYFCDLFAAGFADALIHSLSPTSNFK